MSTIRGAEGITLAGPPRKVTAVVRLVAPPGAVMSVELLIAGKPVIYRASVRRFGEGTSEIRLRLPRDTPPGIYVGEAVLGDEELPITVEVEAAGKLRVRPKQTLLSAEAGSRAEFVVVVLNSGNVSVDIPKAGVFDLDDTEDQDRAWGRTLRAKLPEGEHRIDRFFEEIRGSHGGEARVAVRTGGGRLDPGESSELSCLLDVPVTVQVGRSYLGAWQIANASQLIVVEVRKGAPKQRRTRG